ncbi:DUF1760-domain-containing protein [Polychaeton citri CBS 116435]|uniref:DUF1760-domain-containing protein n=1 Tax=Polychaeton citri CBS 116435 TaxID=1314669 RepID=A0A9P4Q362_9PEZI|nr:DUF1760-domain-containing protein [Polychaeton citri CBS 116435]
MTEDESPLIKALPPATDYLTYLTLVEYNLSKETLPVLHKVLQDESLTINIGWDLVHLLVSLLPESEECLQDIARLGNPREVILKVTESLRLIDYRELEPEDANEGNEEQKTKARASSHPAVTQPVTASTASGTTQALVAPPTLPLPVNQFNALLSMLSILHPRIKTQYPSRFLSTTLQAILASFSSSVAHREEMVLAIVKNVKSIQHIQRPVLPSRQSSGLLGSGMPAMSTPQQASGELSLIAPDPEASRNAGDSPQELSLQAKLFQSFTTHVLEEYLLNLSDPNDDVPGMAWCSRMMEKLQPRRSIPGVQTFASKFNEEEIYQRRIDSVGQLVTLAKDLKLNNKDLLSASIDVDKSADSTKEEDDPPSDAGDIPLSRAGSFLLYAAREVSAILYGVSGSEDTPFAVFPDHEAILKCCLSSPAGGTGALGTEPEALIDAVIALGLICVENNAVGEPQSDEHFMEYLQETALLSANCPSPNLRGHAHYLTSTVLRSQPDENVRLAFIRDTLEHCPFENLKVSAVAWIKGETIEANPPTPIMTGHHDYAKESSSEDSIFARPLALDSIAPFLFPSLKADLVTAPISEAFTAFQANLSFYLASLNFIYLLLHATHLHNNLAIADLWTNNDIAGSFLQPLREANTRFGKALEGGGELAEEKTDSLLGELKLLEETLQRVTKAVPKLNQR